MNEKSVVLVNLHSGSEAADHILYVVDQEKEHAAEEAVKKGFAAWKEGCSDDTVEEYMDKALHDAGICFETASCAPVDFYI